MGLGPQRNDSKTFGTLTHPNVKSPLDAWLLLFFCKFGVARVAYLYLQKTCINHLMLL